MTRRSHSTPGPDQTALLESDGITATPEADPRQWSEAAAGVLALIRDARYPSQLRPRVIMGAMARARIQEPEFSDLVGLRDERLASMQAPDTEPHVDAMPSAPEEPAWTPSRILDTMPDLSGQPDPRRMQLPPRDRE